jgi:hypothetical protein
MKKALMLQVEEIKNEGPGELFVYLKPGYSFSDPPQHCFGAASQQEIERTLLRVKRCQCFECETMHV